jgi:hypothetical protein
MFANYLQSIFSTPSPMSSPSSYPTASTEIPSVSAQPSLSSQPSKSLRPSKVPEYLGLPNNSTNGTIYPSTQPTTSSEPTYEPSTTPGKIELTTLFGWVDQLLPETSKPTAVPTINLVSLDNTTSQSPSSSPVDLTEIPSITQTSISSEIIFPPTSQPSPQDNTIDGIISSTKPSATTSEPNIIVSTPVKDEAWWDVSSSISLRLQNYCVPLLTSVTVTFIWM